MKIIEYSSYVITLLLILIAVFHWYKNKIRPWREIGFSVDNKTLLDILAVLLIAELQ